MPEAGRGAGIPLPTAHHQKLHGQVQSRPALEEERQPDQVGQLLVRRHMEAEGGIEGSVEDEEAECIHHREGGHLPEEWHRAATG